MSDSLRDAVNSLFGERAGEFSDSEPSCEAADRIEEILAADFAPKVAHDIAFHLTDWRGDAARLVAIINSPGSFSDDEIRSTLTAFLLHAPNHIVAAAKLGGWPANDIFGIGALDGTDGNEGTAV